MATDLFANFGCLVDGLTGESFGPSKINLLVARKKSELGGEIPSGNFILFKLSNGVDFFVTLFACWELRLIPVIMPPRSTSLETETVRAFFRARAVVRDDGIELFAPAAGTGVDLPGDIKQTTALVLLTSGTLGDPKAIFLPFQALAEKFSALADVIPIEQRRHTMCFLPLCFGHGLICNSLFPLLSGSTLFIFPSFDLTMTAQYLDAIQQHGIHFFSSVPVILKILIQSPLVSHDLRRVHCASAPLPVDVWNAADRWIGNGTKLTHVFGLTEFSGWVAGSDNLGPRAAGYVGRPWGVEIQTRDPQQAMSEVLLRGAGCMSGYLEAGQFHPVRRDQWFPTQDLGKIDERGSLTLMGRQKEMINYGGFKVHPQDIDMLLIQHPAVQDVCSFAMINENLGEVPAAACVLKGPVSERELKAWCAERIHANKVPVKWFFVDHLPVSERGKISRHQVRRMCETLPR